MKTHFSIKFIYWIVKAMFWGSVISLLVMIMGVVLGIFNSESASFFKISVPLNVNLLSISEVNINEIPMPVTISEITGNFNVWDFGLKTAAIIFSSILFNGLVLIYSLWLLMKMVINVKNKLVFTLENVSYLKRSSYLFFLMWITADIGLKYYIYLISGLDTKLRLSTAYFFPSTFIIASILLVVAYIFERGVKIQQEQSLTI